MTSDRLDVWLYGTRVAEIQQERPGRISLAWTAEAEERWGRGIRVLSSKLTVGDTPVQPLVKAYLDGLLPEGNARVNYAMSADLTVDDTFGLIEFYGRDTPGAAIFVPKGAPDPSSAGQYVPLSLDEVVDRLRRADRYQPAGPGETTESSTLPGMVPKITLHRDDDQWFACRGGAPSTWILKRSAPMGAVGEDVVDTEVASLALARRLGLTTIDAEVLELGDIRAIAVSRYDRAPGNVRIHQEDLAQALGLNTENPARKFQWGSVMPSLRQAAQVLDLDGGDRRQLLRQVTLSFLLGNTDLHAKNLSFLRHDDGQVELTPAYDIAMHLHHPREERRFAMDLNGKYHMDALTIHDVLEEGSLWGMERRLARKVVSEVVEGAAEAVAKIDRDAHPGVSEAAWKCVEGRIKAAFELLPVPTGTAASTPTWSGNATSKANGQDIGEATERPQRRGPQRPR